MPREASKRNNWEKERRERFNKTFDELAQILPSYHPSVIINRIDILKEAIVTISELKKEIDKLSESPDEAKTYKDELVKKLQDRIKKLIIRNEQLVKLFQNAGIKLPRSKSKKEKENRNSKGSVTRIKKPKSPKNQTNNHLKTNNRTRKAPQPKKVTKKCPANNNLLLFSRLSTVPIYNQQFVLVPSSPVVNSSRIATFVTAPPKKRKSTKSPASAKATKISSPAPSLRPGTLILANGNIISVVSQPQILVPPLQAIKSKPMINPALQSLQIPSRVNQSLNPQSAINLGPKIKSVVNPNLIKIEPKDCVTRTTQINKVPIPAFTSKYGNGSLLLKNQNKNAKKRESNKNSTVKRKNDNKTNTTTKKRKICDENNEPTSVVNQEKIESKEKSTNTSNVIANSVETVAKLKETENQEMTGNHTQTTKISDDITKNTKENVSNANNIQNIITTEPVISKSTFSEPTSSVASIQKEKHESSNTISIAASTTSSSIPIIVTTTSSTTPIQDQNFVHSDLSNEIFASLQVPAGCQNMESTSPTAAFLLTFPLVSSIKATEVIDDNSYSQRETPTLLQIGNIDSSKPSQNDSLLNLDNFSFFTSKDIYYNSKMEEKISQSSDNNKSKTDNSQRIEADNQNFTLFEQKVEEVPQVNDYKNNLVVPSPNDHAFDIIPDVDQRGYGNINHKENGKEQSRCSNETNKKSSTKINESIENSTASKKIEDGCQQDNLMNYPPNSGENVEFIQTEQQNVIFSSTSKLSAKMSGKNESNKERETYNYIGGSFRKINESNQNLKNPNSSKNYHHNFEPNMKSYDCNTAKLPESFQLNAKISKQEVDSPKSFCNQKQFSSNNQQLNSFSPSSDKVVLEEGSENFEKTMTEKTYQHFLSNEFQFSSNSTKIPEKPAENLEDSGATKACHFNPKQYEPNLNIFGAKISEGSGQNLKTSETNKTYYHNTANFSFNSVKASQMSVGNLEQSDASKSFQYNQKAFELNLNYFGPNPTSSVKSEKSDTSKSSQYDPKQVDFNLHTFVSNSAQIPEIARQNLEKAGSNKTCYDATNFATNSAKMPKKSKHLEESDALKSCLYNPKEFELNLNSFAPNQTKIPEISRSNVEKPEGHKSYLYNTKFVPSNPAKMLEKSAENLEETVTVKSCNNNPKQIEPNLNSFATNLEKIPETSGQNSEKSVTNKTFYYNTPIFPFNSEKIPEKPAGNSGETVAAKTDHYNPKQFELNLNIFGSNPSQVPETSRQNLEKSVNKNYYNMSSFSPNSSRISENPCHYNPKMNEHNFALNPIKVPEDSGQNIEKSGENKSYYYNTTNFSPNLAKTVEKSENLEATKSCQYKLKQVELNLNTFGPPNPAKIPEASRQNLEKTDIKKTYYYDTTNFSFNAAKIPEKSTENLDQSDVSKTCHYNPKQFEVNLNNFAPNPVKIPETTGQNLEKSDTNKTYYYNMANFSCNSEKGAKESSDSVKTYQYNPFEVVSTQREISSNDTCNKINTTDKGRQAKLPDPSKMLEVCPKSVEEKSCYFSSNHTSTSYKPTTISYENKPHTNPFYSNCNYTHSYSDNNFNQNYYKTDTKPNYSLNYESYQEYRRTDGSFTKDRRNISSKEKQVQQNKPVNWMTTEQKPHSSDCFLPTFTNQSYSFTSCITTDTTDNFVDGKKIAETTEKRFTWSPSKLPTFLEPTHNFITPTLPTLVGDLALGNSLPLADPKYPKDVKRKTYDNQANFLSVSQLVSQNKNETTPARTVSRRLSGSKTKNAVSSKKRFDKSLDKVSKNVNNFSDVFYDQKNRPSTKNISSNYSAEALIGNQCPQDEKKFPQNNNKTCTSFLAENIVPYFTTAEETYINQNSHTYTHNSFQNNNCCSNSFIYTTPSITSSYFTNNFENTSDYSAESIMNYCGVKDNKNCGNKNYRMTNKDDKNINYSNSKKNKKVNQSNNTGLGNFDYTLLPIQGSTNSHILSDDFQSHTTFLPPTTPYNCKNSLYQKQGSEFNTTPLLPLPGITRSNIQNPEVSPSLNPVGTSLTNFNLSTIFPEINKGTIPNVLSSSNNKVKNSSNYMETPSFNSDTKYGFMG